MIDVNKPQQKFRQVPNLLASAVDEEVVMANLATGKYFGLDPVGTRIWHLLAQPQTVGDLCAHLLTLFDVDAVTCRQEVQALLEALVAAKLVQEAV